MRFVHALIARRRRRRSGVASPRPPLTFDALVARAMTQQRAAPLENKRPNYLPDPGAAGRIGLALGAGLSLYATIATIPTACALGGWWLLCLITIPVLSTLALRCGTKLATSIKEHAGPEDADGSIIAVVLRTIFWPISETLCVFFGWIIPYTYYGIEKIDAWCRRGRQLPKSDAASPDTYADAVRRVPDLIVAILKEERNQLFGPGSTYSILCSHIAEQLVEARRLHAYFVRRVESAGGAERRSTAADRAKMVSDQLEAEQRQLHEWQAKVDVELDAYRQCVQGLGPEIDELVHYRALSRLEESVESLAAEVQALIAEMTVDLLTRVQERCAELSGVLHDAGVQIAVAAADTHDADRDARIITSTVRELVRRVPAYEADAAREMLRQPRATVRG